MHASGRYHSNKLATASYRTGDVQAPAIMSFAQSVKARLRLAMPLIRHHQERGVEEGLLCFGHRYMPLDTQMLDSSGHPLPAGSWLAALVVEFIDRLNCAQMSNIQMVPYQRATRRQHLRRHLPMWPG
jgi:hypothetical protein